MEGDMDLDKLTPQTAPVVLHGVTYKVPVGIDALPLRAVIACQQAQGAMKKLAALTHPGAELLTDTDERAVMAFLSAATKIPGDILGDCSMPQLSELLRLIFPSVPQTAPMPRDPATTPHPEVAP